MAELKRSNVYGNLNLRSMTYPEVDDKGNPKKDSKGNIITKSVGPSFKTAATPKNSSGGTVNNSGASQWVESKDVGTGLVDALQDKLQDYLGRNEEISIGYYCGRKLQTAAEKKNEKDIRELLQSKSIDPNHIEEYVNGYRKLSALKTTAGKTYSFTDDKELKTLKKPPSSPWRADTEDIKDKDGKVTGQKAVINARLIGDHIKIFGRLKYIGEKDLNGNLTNKVILRLQLKGMKGKKIKKIWKACGTCAGFGAASAIYVTNVQDVNQRTSRKEGNKWTYNNTKFEPCPNTADPRTPESDGSIWIDIMLSATATSIQKSDKFSFYINCPVTFEK